jgi:hypothetical protein
MSNPDNTKLPENDRIKSLIPIHGIAAMMETGDSDRGFLMWIHERLEHVHGESPLIDYMHQLRAIIAEMNPAQRTASCGQGKNGIEELQAAILGENTPDMHR